MRARRSFYLSLIRLIEVSEPVCQVQVLSNPRQSIAVLYCIGLPTRWWWGGSGHWRTATKDTHQFMNESRVLLRILIFPQPDGLVAPLVGGLYQRDQMVGPKCRGQVECGLNAGCPQV